MNLIVAFDKNGLIGDGDKLPWKIPNDLKYFKEKTTNKTVVMGKKTFDSIGKPFPNRNNIVVSRNKKLKIKGATVVNDIDNIELNEDVFIIGGAEIFNHFLDKVKYMHITYIDNEFKGDVYFPQIDWGKWYLVSSEKGTRDDKNNEDYYFRLYKKKEEEA